MQWIPSWLAKPYAKLYAKKGTEWFDFEEAKEILNIEDKRLLSLRLARLEESGFLISKRDSIDRRKKYYREIQPNDVIFSYSVQASLSSKDDTMSRIASASEKMDLVVGNSYAAYVHTGYATPGKIDIYIRKQDTDKWIALLSDKSTSISIDDMLSEKTAKTNVHLHSHLTEEMINESVKLGDGIRYQSAEALIIEGLEEQTEFSLTDSLAILIKKRNDIDLDKLLKYAKNENLQRELGACLEIINLESKKKIFGETLLQKILNSIPRDLPTKFFPRNRTDETAEYKKFSDVWRLRICISKALVSKITTDLER